MADREAPQAGTPVTPDFDTRRSPHSGVARSTRCIPSARSHDAFLAMDAALASRAEALAADRAG
jgi:hypothetical protein